MQVMQENLVENSSLHKQTVSKLLAKLVMDGKTSIKKVYDPTCGERVIIVMGAVCANKSTVSGTLTKYISYIA